MNVFFIEGQQAARNGKSRSENPYTNGFTKLGSARLTENGIEWENGFNSVATRTATKAEVAAAEMVNIHRFARKSNRFYS